MKKEAISSDGDEAYDDDFDDDDKVGNSKEEKKIDIPSA